MIIPSPEPEHEVWNFGGTEEVLLATESLVMLHQEQLDAELPENKHRRFSNSHGRLHQDQRKRGSCASKT